MIESEKSWDPISLDEIDTIFSTASFPWWIAGGKAIELAVGESLRTHADTDVFILRKDHVEARSLLSNWDCWAADPPGSLRPWQTGEILKQSVHDIWCRRSFADSWHFQLMIDESSGRDWVSRRDGRVQASVEAITRTSAEGIPYLAPHILLYYKAKNLREKDTVDFEAVLRNDVPIDIDWLRNALVLTYGATHPWLSSIARHADFGR